MEFKGFFSKEELLSIEMSDISIRKSKKFYRCEECGLYKTCKSSKMRWTGEGKRKTLIIAEAPGKTEDDQNIQLIGEAGQLLRKKLKIRGLDLDRDFYKDNSLACRPPNNAKPTKQQLKCCKPRLERVIAEIKPEFIWLFGDSALESFYMERDKHLQISTWRGLCIPDKSTNAYILPMYHPSFVKRKEEDKIINSVFDRDLDFAISCWEEKPFQFKNPLDYIYPLTIFDDVCDILEIILEEKPEWLAFDYETTGLKPYNDGHKIAIISACDKADYAFSFPFQYKDYWSPLQYKQIEKRWKSILLEKKIRKIAQNSKFEFVWSNKILQITPANLDWCTMNASHLIGGRKHATSLDHQALINFGIENYGKTIKSFLEKNNERGFNDIFNVPLNDLLVYSAIDSLVTKWLFDKQYFLFENTLTKAREFIQDSLLTLGEMELIGINIDKGYYEKTFLELGNEIEMIKENLEKSKEAQLYERAYKEKVNFNSSTHLRKFFFDLLGIKATKRTTSNNFYSVDKDVIEKIEHPIALDLLKVRKLEKTRNTYLAQFLREINDDERIHPFFNLHTVITSRSSSDHPNLQNIPIHEETAKKITRSGIIPSKGNQILDFDYGQQEVRIGACYTHDPVLIAYIMNPKTDMHRDTAADIFSLPLDKVTNQLRRNTKSGFVFPEWYGSYYKNTARNLWITSSSLNLDDGQPLLDHLYQIGICKRKDAYIDFEEHIRKIEQEFWNKFKVFRKAQELQIEKFIKNGYLEMFHGFRISGYLTRNKLFNYLIQGTAFHCLMWSLNKIRERIKEENLQTKIIGEIHDNGLYDVFPSEKKRIIEITEDISLKQIREEHPWIIVPLSLEWEETGTDESWYAKKKYNY